MEGLYRNLSEWHHSHVAFTRCCAWCAEVKLCVGSTHEYRHITAAGRNRSLANETFVVEPVLAGQDLADVIAALLQALPKCRFGTPGLPAHTPFCFRSILGIVGASAFVNFSRAGLF